jgi:thioredoxin 1
MITEIKDNDVTAINASPLALVDFNASWCGPCKMLAPVLEELSEEITDIDFFSLDIDENPVLSVSNKIYSVPTLLLLKKGEVVAKTIGFSPKEELLEWLNQNR